MGVIDTARLLYYRGVGGWNGDHSDYRPNEKRVTIAGVVALGVAGLGLNHNIDLPTAVILGSAYVLITLFQGLMAYSKLKRQNQAYGTTIIVMAKTNIK